MFSCFLLNLSAVFLVPPDVTVSSLCGAVVNEGSDCRLTCAASGGNPQTYTYQWRFQYKFSSSYRSLSNETDTELLLQSARYTNAGTYQCIVTNTGGSVSDTIVLNVNCKCVDNSPDIVLIMFIALS